MNKIHSEIESILKDAGITGNLLLSTPPDKSLGDIALGCFALAKDLGKSPAEAATEITSKIDLSRYEALESVAAAGPYVNFTLNGAWVAKTAGEIITDTYGSHTEGEGKKYLVEFACPNPMKAFHLGHLRNTITGESVCRILENSGYNVVRTNYQGDVGMHIAKSLWGIYQDIDGFNSIKEKDAKERVEFLGAAYAKGAQAFEKDEKSKEEILEFNKKVYERDESIQEVYKLARQWSLDYFDTIYKKLDTRFDRLYFESEVDEAGKNLVNKYVEKNVFKKSEGAIIFEGSKHGLHDRVFINSKGFPTYEGKDIGLATLHFSDHNPDKVIHVVGKEQAPYFKVVFKALEQVIPETTGKEQHLVGGYLQLKGDVKMSSRLGNVVTGDSLLAQVEEQVKEIMKDSDLKDKNSVAESVAIAALKYTMLKVGVSDDVAFDIKESVSVTGDSGPYLLYITARIKSILRKSGEESQSHKLQATSSIHQTEKALLLHLLSYPDVTSKATEKLNPAVVAKYVFDLAQKFNSFYHECPVLNSEGETREFRLALIAHTLSIMEKGLYLLGIESVEEM